MNRWYKGLFAGIVPIWLVDPTAGHFILPRGKLGHWLLPPVYASVAAFNQFLHWMDPDLEPFDPVRYDTMTFYSRPELPEA